MIARRSTGFLYCVSVAGITGERDRLPAELLDQLAWLRTQTDLPLCVGFGISKPEHVRMLREAADGVIVGSALVRKLEQAGTRPLPQIIEEIGELAQIALRRPGYPCLRTLSVAAARPPIRGTQPSNRCWSRCRVPG